MLYQAAAHHHTRGLHCTAGCQQCRAPGSTACCCLSLCVLTSVGACCLQEYNELSIVGSTRYVVEQGCLIRHVLTGREATSLFAVGASRDAARQLKAEMGDVNPHFMKWSGSDGAKFTFETPEAAAQAFEDVLVRTGGQKHALWSSLQPFIQGQREATMTQVGGRKNKNRCRVLSTWLNTYGLLNSSNGLLLNGMIFMRLCQRHSTPSIV